MPASVFNTKSPWSFLDHSEDSSQTNEIPIQAPFLIGRHDSADLCLSCISVSGNHAELVFKNDELWINDLDSTNGTFVNGVRIIASSQLEKGDVVQFGSMVYQVAKTEASKPVKRRAPVQTLESSIPESPEGRFHRLLRVGVVPFFQPVFDITSDVSKISGYEVLGRGRMPGLCTPEEMFTAASEMEKTAELSESLRKHGIEVADANFSSGKLIFVNTHSSELLSDSLGESLAKIRSNYPDRNFILEIPASILEVHEKIAFIDSATRDLNIDLSVYGLGCDVVHLAELQRLAPKVAKISVDSIRNIEKAARGKHQLVSTVVKMLLELGIQPMAEKVETAGEHETIKQLGFQLAQGYHYGRPSSIEDCLEPDSVEVSSDAESLLIPEARPEKESPQKIASTPNTSSRKVSGTSWVMEQPENHYTIQAMVTISKRAAEDYVAKQNAPDQFVIYPKQGKRRALFVVINGSFASRGAAKAVSEELKDSSSFPLIRRFANVQSEAQQTVS